MIEDAAIIEAYRATGSVWKAGEMLGIAGQTVHGRLSKLGISTAMNVWSKADDDRLVADYLTFRSQGKLDILADSMGRTKQFMCRKARGLGLTSAKGERRYLAVWKYKTNTELRQIFDAFRAFPFGVGAFCLANGYDDLGFMHAMKGAFPDEYLATVESKRDPASGYAIGRTVEYAACDDARRAGLHPLRAPLSSGPADVVAIGVGALYLIQCKRRCAVGVEEWNVLFGLAKSIGAVALVCFESEAGEISYMRLTGQKDGSKRRQPMTPFVFPQLAE